MKLKTAFLIIALVCFWIIMPNSDTGAAEPAPSPKAMLEQTTFAFSPVIAGTEVSHVFSISNKGNAPLNIPGVYSK
jgi:hypothetical protein